MLGDVKSLLELPFIRVWSGLSALGEKILGWSNRDDDPTGRRARELPQGPKSSPEREAESRSAFADPSEHALRAENQGASSGTFRSVKRAKALILFVDDSAIATLKMLELLRGAGYDVATASNGKSAIRMARELSPSLILMDVEMPEMRGTDACAGLKTDPRTASIPVVLMTAHDDPRQLRDGFRSGCDGYIPKGTSDAEVLRKLSLKLLPGTSLQSK